MADKTPKKTLPEHVCRCCNSTLVNNPIDLFGVKSENDQLIGLLEKVTGLTFVVSDGFPRKICRSCYSRVKQFAEFKDLCVKSRTEQENSVRFKRAKKATESPSATEERQRKRGKHDDMDPEPSARQCLQMQFSLIHPKAAPDLQEQPLENSNSAAGKIRTLPKSIQPPPAAETCKGMLILAKSGLRNSEVCIKRCCIICSYS